MDVIEVHDILIPVQQIQTIKVGNVDGRKTYILMMPYGNVDLTPEQTETFDSLGIITSTTNLNPSRGGYEAVLAKVLKNPEKAKRPKPTIEGRKALESVIKANED